MGKPSLERSPPLRRVETAGFDLPGPQHVRERLRPAGYRIDGLAPAGAQKIVRIVPIRQARKLQALPRPEQRQGEINAPICGAPAGGIAVEAQRGLFRQSPKQL